MEISSFRGKPLGTSHRTNVTILSEKGETTLAQVTVPEVSRKPQEAVETRLESSTEMETPPPSTFLGTATEKNLHTQIVREQLRHGTQGAARSGGQLAFGPGGGSPPAPAPFATPTDTTSPKPLKDEYAAPKRIPRGKPELFPKDVLERTAAKPPKDAPVAPSGDVEVAAARMRFEELPAKLQETLKKSFPHPDEFWAGLGDSQRQSLASTFNRLDAMGLWKHVAKVTGEHAQPEKPIGGKLKVAGNSGGISFEAHDEKAFVDDLLRSRKFGVDPAVAALLHKGQTSLRENNPTEGSLHISVGPGRHFDTHIDKVGAVDAPDSKTRGAVFNPTRSLEHHSKEVWPEMIRKGTKVPGVFVGVGPDLADVTRSRTPADDKTPGPPKLKDHDVLGSVNFVVQLAGKEDRIQHPREKDTAMVDTQVMKRAVERGAAEATPDQLRRKGVKSNNPQYSNSADPSALASSLAGHLANAGRDGRLTAEIKLPAYYDNLSAPERKEIATTIGRIAKAVAAEMPEDTRGVRSLKISFGSRNEYNSLSD